MRHFDYLLVGGGLQNGLIAAALNAYRPGASVAVVERARRVGGNHTWCFHAADIATEARCFVEPFVATRWPAYRVRFPKLERTLDEPYAAVTSDSFARELEALAQRGRLELACGDGVVDVEPFIDGGKVVLASGREIFATTIIEARGPEAFARSNALGFQKFVGLELDVDPSTTPLLPTLMDASVPQLGGFRFMYVLPLAPGRVLVEDTYFADDPELDVAFARGEIHAYAERLGLRVRACAREETGVLPLPARPPAAAPVAEGVLKAGYQGGFFHPTTGYSFPLAVRVATTIAATPPDRLRETLARLAEKEARQQRYAALLNRLLFSAFAPSERFHALERFYRLPAATVRRFYALTLTRWDRTRILCGRPPRGFSLGRALRGNGRALPVLSLPGENA